MQHKAPNSFPDQMLGTRLVQVCESLKGSQSIVNDASKIKVKLKCKLFTFRSLNTNTTITAHIQTTLYCACVLRCLHHGKYCAKIPEIRCKLTFHQS